MRIQTLGIALLIAMLAPVVARTEIILDDFDEAFEITLPEMDETYVVHSAVGPLRAERWARVVALLSEPRGRAAADLVQSSALTFEFDHVYRTSDIRLPVISLNLLYFFDEVDITQGGINDRVVVDFAYLHSAIPMAQVSVFLQDSSQPGTSYGRQLFEIVASDEPFALDFPLASFAVRGGGAGQIDYERVYQLSLNITPVFFSDIEAINFSTAVERIRFANAIPEPATGTAVCLGLAGTVSMLARNRRWSREV